MDLFRDNAKKIMKSHYRNVKWCKNSYIDQVLKTNLLIKTSDSGCDFDKERYFFVVEDENVYYQLEFCEKCGNYIEEYSQLPELIPGSAICKC